jgi:hypothetical protein
MTDSSSTAKACLFAGVFGIVVLAWQWLDVYFAIGDVPTPTHGQVIRFRVTAALTIGAMLVALVLALRGEHRWVGRAAGIGLALAVVTAAVLAVPTLDLRRDPELGGGSGGSSGGGTPCFSGTVCDDAG